MNILAPSILSADFCRLGSDIEKVEKSGAQYLHFDVMDGMFVPSISFGMPVLKCVRKCSDMFMDVHMMVERPERYIDDFARAGADGITIHVEACDSPLTVEKTLSHIKELGLKAGIAINPSTDVKEVVPFMPYADMVLIMTVNPGFGGQKYIDECTDKIRHVRKLIDEKYPYMLLEIDGGINADNLLMNLEAGANVIVAGSALFRGDIEANTAEFMRIMKLE